MSDEWVTRVGESWGMTLDVDGTTTIYENGEVVERIAPKPALAWMGRGCDVYWGSHGCSRPKGHSGWCVCCEHSGFPYYGQTTSFYGDHAEMAQARLDRAYRFPAGLVLPLRAAVVRWRLARMFAPWRP